jgi:hypothetical protein
LPNYYIFHTDPIPVVKEEKKEEEKKPDNSYLPPELRLFMSDSVMSKTVSISSSISMKLFPKND